MSSPAPGAVRPCPLLPQGIPRIVGIVNITEDSFSDGGRYLNRAAASGSASLKDAFGVPVLASRSRYWFLRALTGRYVRRSGPRRSPPRSSRQAGSRLHPHPRRGGRPRRAHRPGSHHRQAAASPAMFPGSSEGVACS